MKSEFIIMNPEFGILNYGESTILDSQKDIFVELVGTWNGDPGVSDHLWTDFFGAELSGGVPGAGGRHEKIRFACNVEAWAMNNTKQNQSLSPDFRCGPLDRCIWLKIALRIQLDRSRGQQKHLTNQQNIQLPIYRPGRPLCY